MPGHGRLPGFRHATTAMLGHGHRWLPLVHASVAMLALIRILLELLLAVPVSIALRERFQRALRRHAMHVMSICGLL